MGHLGMGKPLSKTAAESSSSAFVAFKNGTLPIVPKQGEEKGKNLSKSLDFSYFGYR